MFQSLEIILHSNFHDLVLSYGDDVPTLGTISSILATLDFILSSGWWCLHTWTYIPMLHPCTSLLHILMWLMTVHCLLPVSLQLCSSSDCSLTNCRLTDCPVSLLYISLLHLCNLIWLATTTSPVLRRSTSLWSPFEVSTWFYQLPWTPPGTVVSTWPPASLCGLHSLSVPVLLST